LVKGSEKTAERQLRAYVFVEGFKVDLLFDEKTRKLISRTIWITWKNSGNTPTRHLRLNTDWGAFGSEMPKGFDFPTSDPPQAGMLGPGQIMRTRACPFYFEA
jgi:hypothetical protein